MLGEPVAKAFLKAGYEVSLLVRNPARASALAADGAMVVKGDLNDPRSLEEFLRGQEWVYLNLAADQSSRETDFQPEREGLKNLLDAARKAGIRRIGYLSSLVKDYTGTDWWVLKMKRESAKAILESGIPYSIFYPSTFMESFGKGAFRQGNRLNLAGKSLFPMYLIAGEDYGRQVVTAFETGTENHQYIIQGTEAFTVEEAARLFAANYTKAPQKISHLPMGLLNFLGVISNKFNYIAHIVDALNNFPEKFEGEKAWKELGKPTIRYIDYIRSV